MKLTTFASKYTKHIPVDMPKKKISQYHLKGKQFREWFDNEFGLDPI